MLLQPSLTKGQSVYLPVYRSRMPNLETACDSFPCHLLPWRPSCGVQVRGNDLENDCQIKVP